MRRPWFAWLLLFGIAGNLAATPIPLSANQEAHYHRLLQDLRCLVCQNQDLADSNAALADDLRQEVRSRLAQGDSESEVKHYLQSRYGDFILLKPPLKSITLLLWFGPFLLLALGLLKLWSLLRRSSCS